MNTQFVSHQMLRRLFLAATAAISLLVASCGGGGEDSAAAIGGPAGAAAFVGTSIGFNPTLKFLDGGVLEYVNEEVGSLFPQAAALTPSVGTYTYAPSSDFLTGTLTINLPDLNGGFSRTIALSEFVTSAGIIEKFTGAFTPEGPYEMTVSTGTLRAAGKVDPTTKSPDGEFTLRSDGSLVPGTQFSRTNLYTVIGFWGNDGTPLVPRSVGDVVNFTVAANGRLEFGGLRPFYYYEPSAAVTHSLGFVSSSAGVLTYQGVPTAGFGLIRVVIDITGAKNLSIQWTENDVVTADTERQFYR